jgi:hypothetical protein
MRDIVPADPNCEPGSTEHEARGAEPIVGLQVHRRGALRPRVLPIQQLAEQAVACVHEYESQQEEIENRRRIVKCLEM